jgi:hypothetical protein
MFVICGAITKLANPMIRIDLKEVIAMRIMVVIISLVLLSSFSTANAFFAEITIDGNFEDWAPIKGYSDDEGDTFGGPADPTMDILSYKIANDDKFLYVMVTVKEDISKGTTSRGAYQAIIDSDNNYNTGIQSDKETPYPPHEEPLGVDRYVSLETKVGQVQGVGMAGFKKDADQIGGAGEFKLPEAICDVEVVGNQYELCADLKSLGIDMESKTRIAILHYSAENTVDWTMPAITYFVTLLPPGDVDVNDKAVTMWGKIKSAF